tara:strand:- start:285 stop:548 length:264 start_codon:yes stop_codon:yes gene_type:complete
MFDVARPLMTNLMDDLAENIHRHLYEISTEFNGSHFVLIPITEVVKKFERNHRTIQRRINALKNEGLLVPIIKRNTITLYQIIDKED